MTARTTSYRKFLVNYVLLHVTYLILTSIRDQDNIMIRPIMISYLVCVCVLVRPPVVGQLLFMQFQSLVSPQ
jgi:hypothetical protein